MAKRSASSPSDAVFPFPATATQLPPHPIAARRVSSAPNPSANTIATTATHNPAATATSAAGGGGAIHPTTPTSSLRLERFTAAKSEIAHILSRLIECLDDVESLLSGPLLPPLTLLPQSDGASSDIDSGGTDAKAGWCDEIRQARAKAGSIRDAVKRRAMKIVFVGRTSSGKSTTINALLGTRVLPAGAGHTTSCFVALRGTSEETAYALIPKQEGSESDQACVIDREASSVQTARRCSSRRPIEDITALAHALYPEAHLSRNSVIELFWPSAHCRVLQHDVVIVDSPGLDVDRDYDAWIDAHCADADLFVLATSAMAAITRAERHFFERVCAHVARPNVFVEFTRWDTVEEECAEEEGTPLDRLRSHQIQSVVSLFAELGLGDAAHATRCLFFVSPREALLRNINSPSSPPSSTDSSSSIDSSSTSFSFSSNNRSSTNNIEAKPAVDTAARRRAEARHHEFSLLESRLESTVSTAAIATRFRQHVLEGKSLARVAARHLSLVAYSAAEKAGAAQDKLALRQRQLLQLRARLDNMRNTWAREAEAAAEDVRGYVLGALESHIVGVLPGLVLGYQPSAGAPEFMPVAASAPGSAYCVALTEHVRSGLRADLDTTCAGEIRARLDQAVAFIETGVEELLPRTSATESKSSSDSRSSRLAGGTGSGAMTTVTALWRRVQRVAPIDCTALAQGFRPKVCFRFSLNGAPHLVPRWRALSSYVASFMSTSSQAAAEGATFANTISSSAAAAAAIGTEPDFDAPPTATSTVNATRQTDIIDVATSQSSNSIRRSDENSGSSNSRGAGNAGNGMNLFFGALTSPGASAALALGTAVFSRSWTAKLVCASAAACTALFAYEWITYTPSSAEKRYKWQFVSHCRDRLRLLALQAALGEARSARNHLAAVEDSASVRLTAGVQRLEAEIEELGAVLEQLHFLKNETMRLHSAAMTSVLDFEAFSDTYLTGAQEASAF